jgi:predicted nucleic acid-binding protein
LYLLDTDILSIEAPTKRAVPQEAFAAWLRAHGDDLYVSTVTIAEIETGIARAIRIKASTKASRLRKWLSAVEQFYSGRILAFGLEEARQAGAIFDRSRAHSPGFEDVAIAATAAARGFTVLTGNERHFEPLGVPYANPLKRIPRG